MLRLDHHRLAGDTGGDLVAHATEAGRVEKIGLVEHDQIGAGQLILEEFLDRAFMVERFILDAAGFDGIVIVGKTAGGHSGAVDHGDDAVDGDLRADVQAS